MNEEKHMLDIEDLLVKGWESYSCPYFLSRGLLANTDLLVLSYQYIFTAAFRQVVYDHIKDSIIVFDEAHNIINTLEETGSYSVSLEQLKNIYKYLEELSISEIYLMTNKPKS